MPYRYMENHKVRVEDRVLPDVQQPARDQRKEPRDEVLGEGVEEPRAPRGDWRQPEAQPDLLAGTTLGDILHSKVKPGLEKDGKRPEAHCILLPKTLLGESCTSEMGLDGKVSQPQHIRAGSSCRNHPSRHPGQTGGKFGSEGIEESQMVNMQAGQCL